MRTLLIVLTLATFIGCKSGQKASKRDMSKFPSEFANIKLGMTKDEVAKARNFSADGFEDGSFRWTYLEEIGRNGIAHAGYYFDKDNNLPFYEIIIIYDTEELRDAAAAKLLGEPNHENNTEWIWDSGQGYNITAWKFQTKLVIAAQIPETEWDPAENQ